MSFVLTNRCSAYCVAENFDLDALLSHSKALGYPVFSFKNSNVVHRAFKDNGGDIFYFAYGTIVMWGLTKEEEQGILKNINGFANSALEQIEVEESCFTVGETAKIIKDDITLPSTSMLTKLAFSHGLAQSVKLSVFENLVKRRINNSRYIPESLAKNGRISLSRKQLAKMMGQLIVDRNLVNFHTDILDTPEFFWEHSDLEPLYRLIAQDLDIISRVSVLNKRLDILKELFEILSNELENRHSTVLEWIIIVLISIEVLVTFARDIFDII